MQGRQRSSSNTFAIVGKTVVRVGLEFENHPLVFNWARNELKWDPPTVTVAIS